MEKYSLLGSLVVLPQKMYVFFELPRVNFLQCQHDFRMYFQTKKDITRGGGAKPFSEGGGGT